LVLEVALVLEPVDAVVSGLGPLFGVALTLILEGPLDTELSGALTLVLSLGSISTTGALAVLDLVVGGAPLTEAGLGGTQLAPPTRRALPTVLVTLVTSHLHLGLTTRASHLSLLRLLAEVPTTSALQI
jgi:hypothetical protein